MSITDLQSLATTVLFDIRTSSLGVDGTVQHYIHAANKQQACFEARCQHARRSCEPLTAIRTECSEIWPTN